MYKITFTTLDPQDYVHSTYCEDNELSDILTNLAEISTIQFINLIHYKED